MSTAYYHHGGKTGCVCSVLLTLSSAIAAQGRRAIALAILVLTASFVSVVGYCDTIEIFGVPFRVDGANPVDGGNVEVTLFGESVLVPRTALNDYIVKTYFLPGRRGGGLSSDAIQQFIRNALAGRQFRYVSQALTTLVLMGLAGPQFTDFVKELERNQSADEVFKTVIVRLNELTKSGEDPSRWLVACQELVSVVGVSDLTWVQNNAARWTYQYGESFRTTVSEKFFEAVRDGQNEKAQRMLDLLSGLYGQEDPVVQRLRLCYSRLDDIRRAGATHDLETLFSLAEVGARERDMGEALYPLLAQVLHAEAERALESSAPETAIQALARTEMSLRRPQTHRLLERALLNLGPEQGSIIQDPLVKDMLVVIARNDERVLAALEGFLEKSIESGQHGGSLDQAEEELQLLVALRPDPNPKNDALRVSQVIGYVRAGMQAKALQELASRATSLTLGQRISLWFGGFYVPRFFAFLIFFVGLACFLTLLYLQRRRLVQFVKDQPQPRPAREEDFMKGAAEDGRSFVMRGLREGVTEKLSEYNNCVMKLGLSPDADMRDIKAAYRTAVKLYHPDRVTASEKAEKGEQAQRFIEMTEAYERLVVLRKELGLAEPDE